MTHHDALRMVRIALAPTRPPETFGEHLRDLRIARSLTLADVAGRHGLSVVYLSEIERDRKPPPSEDMIAAIVADLGGDVSAMLGRAAAARGRFVLPVVPGDRRQRLGTVLLERWAHLTDEQIERVIAALGAA